ncbi:MAG: serine hydrolase [Bacteroidetes bacterium]|nr:serine hydrolase [Bacteroidota bacterium]
MLRLSKNESKNSSHYAAATWFEILSLFFNQFKMKSAKALFLFLLLGLFFETSILAQVGGSLPRSSPEAQGVSSTHLLNFLDAAAKFSSKYEFHSLMVLRHGKVVAEAWWAPYRPDLKHTLYSCSKSFTATAVGFAIAEGKLRLSDKVITFFSEYVPKEVSPYLEALTIKDLLTMSVGMDPDPSFTLAVTDDNWIKAFFNTPILNQPGTKFLYNSMGTYVAGAIVQKVTGQTLVQYLKPRLFDPLGIGGMDWETDLLGYNVGGWGLRLKTEDMAKFAQLFLQKGQWNGKQILPKGWVEEASTMKILQKPEITQEARDKDDWAQGYCYQMWRSRHNSYRGDGAYGQYMLVLPEQDAVIAVTAEVADMQGEIDLIWDNLFPAFGGDSALPENADTDLLRQRLKKLELRKAKGKVDSPMVSQLDKKCFQFSSNDLQLKQMDFDFEGDVFTLTLIEQDGKKYPIKFGANRWETGTTKRLGPYLVSGIKNQFVGLPPAKIAGSYGWIDENTLQLKLRYIESPHSETFTCQFDAGKVKVVYEKSNDFGGKKIEMIGEQK